MPLDDIDLHGAQSITVNSRDTTIEIRPDGITALIREGDDEHMIGIRRENGHWTLFQERKQGNVYYTWQPDPAAAARLSTMFTDQLQ